MRVEVLGNGCSECRAMLDNTMAAAASTEEEIEVEAVNDAYRMMAYGVTCVPALIVDGKVKSAGRLLSVEEIAALLLFK